MLPGQYCAFIVMVSCYTHQHITIQYIAEVCIMLCMKPSNSVWSHCALQQEALLCTVELCMMLCMILFIATVSSHIVSLQQEAHSQVEPESRLGSKLAGFKNRLMKPSSNPASRAPSGSMDPHMLTQASAAPPAGHSGPSPSPLDFAYDFGALAQDRQEARQATAVEHATASGRYTGSNYR